MLWAASQERLSRERRERLAETFSAGRDAFVHGAISAGLSKPKGMLRLPSYLTPERDPETARRGLARLMHDHPRNVAKGAREFRN